MFILNDIAYANNYNNKELKIIDFKVVSEFCMIITFSNGEERIFDAKYLLKYPVYKRLEDHNIFKDAQIENGILVWDNGRIDIGVEEIYKNSFEYEKEIAL